jgi:cobalt-zinc-cadmium resistance protein CzcA
VDDACVPTSRGPVFYGVLIILLVYVPVLSLAGVDGKMFRPMALTVVLALLCSLVFTLTFVPAVAPRGCCGLRSARRSRRGSCGWHRARARRVLGRAVPARARGAGPRACGSLVAAGPRVHSARHELVPQLDEGDLVMQTTRAPDISLETGAVRERGQRMERIGARGGARRCVQIVSRVGSPAMATDIMGLEQADVFVRLAPRVAVAPRASRGRR